MRYVLSKLVSFPYIDKILNNKILFIDEALLYHELVVYEDCIDFNRTVKGETLLHKIAVKYLANKEIIRIILEHYDIYKKDSDGNTAIHLILTSQKSSVVDKYGYEFFAIYGYDINTKNNKGNTLLHYLASKDDIVSIHMCINDYKANLYVTNDAGKTPLDLLSQNARKIITRSIK